jgi:hypothetical protein
MTRTPKGARTYSVTSESLLPRVTVSTFTAKPRKRNGLTSNINVSQHAFMGAASDWDSTHEVENIWTPNVDPTESETVHLVQSKRRGGKVHTFLLGPNDYTLLIS